jgi:hypothetical protein
MVDLNGLWWAHQHIDLRACSIAHDRTLNPRLEVIAVTYDPSNSEICVIYCAIILTTRPMHCLRE